MFEKDIKLYPSKRFLLLRIMLTGGPLALFIFFTLKGYKENAPVAFIFGIGALAFCVLFLEQARFLYFIMLKKTVLILTKKHLTEKLTGKMILWEEIGNITFCIDKGYKFYDEYILITSKTSDDTIKIRGNLMSSDLKKELRSPEIITLLTKYKKAQR